jgi:hypothetical protein
LYEGFNVLIFPSIIAAWVLACTKQFVAAAIAAFLAVILILISLNSTPPQSDSISYYAAWLANPIIAVTWGLYLKNARPAAPISAMLGLLLTLSFCLVKTIRHFPVDRDYLPDFIPIISYGLGYWLWVASATILAAGSSADVFLFRYMNAPAKVLRE